MPELPEVETIRRDLAAVLVGKKVKSVDILEPKMVSITSAAAVSDSTKNSVLKTAASPAVFFAKNLAGRRVSSIDRRGKLLIFNLTPEKSGFNYLLIHLKMTGQLIYFSADVGRPIIGGHSDNSESDKELKSEIYPNKHTRTIFYFLGGGRLFFNDLRKFGYLKLVDKAALGKILAAGYGPEPLSPEFSLAAFRLMLSKRKNKIKAVLLDQKTLAGLGNIYADESLWAARLRPNRSANSLSAAEVKKLYQTIKRILKQAIKARGTTFNNYRDSRGKKGNFSRLLKVYGRGGAACPACGKAISKIKLAGRGTHYCRYCQK
jgi:formamidopyrimidine-DNA glycosylase